MNSAGGCSTMAGCSNRGLRPKGVTPASAATNGLDPLSSTMSAAKTAPMTHITITAPPVSRSTVFRSMRAMTTATTAMSSSQRRNEPCCPAQKPAMR